MTQLDLSGFTGTEVWHLYSILFPFVVLTDGAKYVADAAGAYWLMDTIAAHQGHRLLRNQPFQVWKLSVDGTQATLTCEDGNGKVLIKEDIRYTDFPDPEITLWADRDGRYTVILLPSEY